MDGGISDNDEFNGSYQLGTLEREVFEKWVNGFWLKPYRGHMSYYSFKDRKKENQREVKNDDKVRGDSSGIKNDNNSRQAMEETRSENQ